MIKVKEEIGKKTKRARCRGTANKSEWINARYAGDLRSKNIKKLADFADLSTDELVGGYDEIRRQKVRFQGYLENFL